MRPLCDRLGSRIATAFLQRQHILEKQIPPRGIAVFRRRNLNLSLSALCVLFICFLGCRASIAATPGNWQSYSVYQPQIERSFVVNAAEQSLKYNHDSSIAWFRDRWFCVWNANTIPREGAPGQLNYVSTSRDGIEWSAPRPAFSDSDLSANSVPCLQGTQWQPNLLVVGTRLWCLWSQASKDKHRGCYLSVLEKPDGRWTNRLLKWSGLADPVIDGKSFRVYPTQNPVRLTTGRVLAPVTLIGSLSTHVSHKKNAWYAKEKRDSVLYTDDDGATWQVSPGAILPGLDWRQWEPTVFEQPDGSVLMFARNNLIGSFEGLNASPEQALVWSISHDRGATWSPHAYVPLQTVVSRMHVLRQPGSDRFIMVHNDWPAGRFCADRNNLALFFNRGGGIDFTAGIGLSGRERQVAYPQMDIHDDSLMICYSQGACGLRNIRVVRVSPLPDPARLYLCPRANLPLSPQCTITNGALRIRGGLSLKCRAAPVLSPNGCKAEILVNPEESGVLFDNRSAKSGFVWALSGTCFIHIGKPAENIISSLIVPRGRWSRLGLALDYAKGEVVFSVDDKTERLTFKPGHRSMAGTSATLFGPNLSASSLTALEGSIRSLVLDGTNRLFDAADRQLIQDKCVMPLTSAIANDGISVLQTDDRHLLRLTGIASAGVELSANDRASGDAVELVFTFRIKRGKTGTLCTAGDANQPARVRFRDGRIRLVAGKQVIDCGPVGTGTWQMLRVLTQGDRTRITLDTGDSAEVRHHPQATWIYLGEGYPQPATSAASSVQTPGLPPAAILDIDISSVRSRILCSLNLRVCAEINSRIFVARRTTDKAREHRNMDIFRVFATKSGVMQ